jgi:hypothetical protein
MPHRNLLKDRLSVPGSPGRRSRRDSASPRLPGSEAPSNEGASPASPPTRRYDRDPFDVLISRGVSREVWEARGYIPYYGKHHPLHDPDLFDREFGKYDLTPEQIQTTKNFMNWARDAHPPKNRSSEFVFGRDREDHEGHGDGLIMPKHQ